MYLFGVFTSLSIHSLMFLFLYLYICLYFIYLYIYLFIHSFNHYWFTPDAVNF